MCGIIGSFDKEKLICLFELNKLRGNKTFSLLSIKNNEIINKIRNIGAFNTNILNNIQFNNETYHIIHIQSPTEITELSKDNIHPSEINNTYLWHNGMLTSEQIKKFNENWDTKIIHKLFLDDLNNLNNLEGSFSCVYFDICRGILLFRNKISPMFIDDECNISSTQFINCKKTTPNTLYKLDFKEKKIIQTDINFNNNYNPFGI